MVLWGQGDGVAPRLEISPPDSFRAGSHNDPRISMFQLIHTLLLAEMNSIC